jgi:hypothetical protein
VTLLFLTMAAFSLYLALVSYYKHFEVELGEFLELLRSRIGVRVFRNAHPREGSEELPVHDSDMPVGRRDRRRRGRGLMVGREDRFSPMVVVIVLAVVLLFGWWLTSLASMEGRMRSKYHVNPFLTATVEVPAFVTSTPVPPLPDAGRP